VDSKNIRILLVDVSHLGLIIVVELQTLGNANLELNNGSMKIIL
jgi:hypothetical protein